MAILDKTRKILRKAFPLPDEVDVWRHGQDQVSGHVVSSRFNALDTFQREDLVNEALDGQLTANEKRKIVLILTSTPEESDWYLAHPFPVNGKKARKSS